MESPKKKVEVRYCDSLDFEKLGISEGCCTSCHEDEGMGYPLSEYCMGTYIIKACCDVGRQVKNIQHCDDDFYCQQLKKHSA